MNDKKIMLLMCTGMIVLLCLSVLIVSVGDIKSERETTVVIDRTEQTEQSSSCETTSTEEYIYLDINKATSDELEKLEGIGKETAGNIIAYREKIGGFANIYEITGAKGVGENKFADIKEHIYVENPYERQTEPATTTAIAITTVSDKNENETETVSTETTTETIIIVYPLDLNTATKVELMQLPYVTEEAADRIISFRNEIGGFSHVYELLYIEELEQKEVAEIIEFVTVGQ